MLKQGGKGWSGGCGVQLVNTFQASRRLHCPELWAVVHISQRNDLRVVVSM